jgi:hypothetical protein
MPSDWYPSDVTHIMIWPDGIAARDPDTNAPRLGRLSFYLRQQVQAHASFEPLHQPDMFGRLQQLRGPLGRNLAATAQPVRSGLTGI